MSTAGRHVTLLVAAAVATGCSAAMPEPPVATVPPSQQALEAYEEYWAVSTAAFQAPDAQDWTPALAEVASGPALDSVLLDVRNYAAYPAHTEGGVSRSPQVVRTSPTDVEIVDCVDLGDSRLVADDTGELLEDLTTRRQRYTFRATVALQADTWRVDRTEPLLDEPC